MMTLFHPIGIPAERIGWDDVTWRPADPQPFDGFSVMNAGELRAWVFQEFPDCAGVKVFNATPAPGMFTLGVVSEKQRSEEMENAAWSIGLASSIMFGLAELHRAGVLSASLGGIVVIPLAVFGLSVRPG